MTLINIVGVIFLNILGEIGYFYINTNHTDKSFPYSLFNSMNNVLNHSYEVTPYTTGILISGIVVAAVSIFMFNYFISFRKATSVYGFTRTQRALASLAFAVVTAPYTFLLPYELFYWFIHSMSAFYHMVSGIYYNKNVSNT